MGIFVSFFIIIVIYVELIRIVFKARQWEPGERLPWLLYFCAVSILFLYLLGMLVAFFVEFNIRPSLSIMMWVVPLLVTAGFVAEAFKQGLQKWYFSALILFVTIISSFLLFRYLNWLNFDGIKGNDSPLIYISFAFLVPAFAGLLAFLQVREKQEKLIYGLFSGGFFLALATTLLYLYKPYNHLTDELLSFGLGGMFCLILAGTALKLKLLPKTQSPQTNDNPKD